MLSSLLSSFYSRDLRKLIEEINLFTNEENLWVTANGVKNSAGNLALHITGGMNYLIGTQLANTGYVPNRDVEFTTKGVPRAELVAGLEALITLIHNTLTTLTPQQMEEDFPLPFDGAVRSNTYILVQLLAHVNYHLGQVNYLRRMIEAIPMH